MNKRFKLINIADLQTFPSLYWSYNSFKIKSDSIPEVKAFILHLLISTVFIHIKAGLKYTQGLKYMPGSAAE